MNWLKTSFSSKLNFSLTKRRLALIGKRSSVSGLYFRALPVLVAFTFSPFLFFDQKEPVNQEVSISLHRHWENQRYSNVELETQPFPFGKDSIGLLMRIPSLKLLNGTPYSGVENFYLKKNDRLHHSTVYVDGLPVHQKIFDDEGNERSFVDFFYNPQKTQRFSIRYYQYGKLSLETIYSSPTYNGAMVFKHWNERGYLEMLSILDIRDPKITYGEVISYDENGNVTFHERYEGLELVEKIK